MNNNLVCIDNNNNSTLRFYHISGKILHTFTVYNTPLLRWRISLHAICLLPRVLMGAHRDTIVLTIIAVTFYAN